MALPERAQRLLAGRPVTIDGQTLAPDVQLMLRLQRLARVPGAEALPIAEGREVVRVTRCSPAVTSRSAACRTLEVADRPARLYVPTGAPPIGPLLVFFHGGGFCTATSTATTRSAGSSRSRQGCGCCRSTTGSAPSTGSPRRTTTRWRRTPGPLEHAAELGADPERLGVGGDSAGGNLAAGVAIEAARQGWPCAVQLLVYPATDARRETRSAELFDRGFYLTARLHGPGRRASTSDGRDLDDPRLSPLHAELPPGLAPALVFTAGFDPLRDEGEAYADRLADAGVQVELTRFPDQIHGFVNIVGVGRSSLAANRRIAQALGSALS